MPALVIVAERLIDGTGRDPVERAAVVIENGRITAGGAAVVVHDSRATLRSSRMTI